MSLAILNDLKEFPPIGNLRKSRVKHLGGSSSMGSIEMKSTTGAATSGNGKVKGNLDWSKLLSSSLTCQPMHFYSLQVIAEEIIITPIVDVITEGKDYWSTSLIAQFIERVPNFSYFQICVLLRNVPLELFTLRGLSYIASGTGKPLFMDKYIANRERVVYAKHQTQVSISELKSKSVAKVEEAAKNSINDKNENMIDETVKVPLVNKGKGIVVDSLSSNDDVQNGDLSFKKSSLPNDNLLRKQPFRLSTLGVQDAVEAMKVQNKKCRR
ncbi:hypothetical protein PTKIN_Ptkin10aG0061700 [Pterospermum kingtungense]